MLYEFKYLALGGELCCQIRRDPPTDRPAALKTGRREESSVLSVWRGNRGGANRNQVRVPQPPGAVTGALSLRLLIFEPPRPRSAPRDRASRGRRSPS